MEITAVTGHRIWDSRGRPTVEVTVTLAGGAYGRGIAPAGASRGSREATELRDGGAALGGYGVDRALQHINGAIAAALTGRDAANPAAIDELLSALDGTPDKSRLGGNALVATSMAVLNAAAAAADVPLWRYIAAGRPVRLPLPEVQIFGGGAHAGRRVDIQDFLVMPVGAESFDHAMVMVAEVYRAAGGLMEERGALAGVADEGGWWPQFDSNEDGLVTLTRAIERAGYAAGEVAISLDIAASEFHLDGLYCPTLDRRPYDTDEWLDVLLGWLNRFPILSLEDPFAENDTAGMRELMQRVGDRVQIVGDDYLATSAARVRDAVATRACNAVLLKPNQAGTVLETFQAFGAARSADWGTIVSARSGETEDATIAHLAVGWNAGQLKVGSITRGERTAKWNEVLRIEAALGADAVFAGRAALPID